MCGIGRGYRASKKVAETALERAPKADVEKVFVAHGQTIHQQYGWHGSYQAVDIRAYMAVVREAEAV
jgi:hypothetical protein